MTYYSGYEVTTKQNSHGWAWTVKESDQVISKGGGYLREEEAIATAHRAIDAMLNPSIHEVFRRRED